MIKRHIKRVVAGMILTCACAFCYWIISIFSALKVERVQEQNGLKMVYQHGKNDCGVACVQMILNSYGKMESYDKTVVSMKPTEYGVSLFSISQYLSSKGIKCYNFKCSVSFLKDINGPALLFVGSNHFVVMDGYSKETGFRVRDPSVGFIVVPEPLMRIWFSDAAMVVVGTDMRRQNVWAL